MDLNGNYSDIPELLKWKQSVSAILLQLAGQATGHLLGPFPLLVDKKWGKNEQTNKMKSKIQDIHLKCAHAQEKIVHVHRKVDLKCHGFTVCSPFCSCIYSLLTLLSYPNQHHALSSSYLPIWYPISAHLAATKDLMDGDAGSFQPKGQDTFSTITATTFP